MAVILNSPGLTYHPAADVTQAEPDYYDWFSLSLALQGFGVTSGGVVSASGSGLHVNVSAVVAKGPNGGLNYGAVGSIALAAADPVNTRIDVVTVDPIGGITVTTGTAETNPSTPTIPDNSIILAVISVLAGMTTLLTEYILDKRWVVAPSTSTFTKTAGIDLSGQRLVVPQSDGSVVYADNTTLSHTSLPIWITLGAASMGDQVEVLAFGETIEPSWTWTPEGSIYLGENGVLTQTVVVPPALFIEQVAVAETTTSIFYDPKIPIQLS